MTRPVRIALVGATGRMGREIIRTLAAYPDVTLGAAVEYPGCPLAGRDPGEIAGVAPCNILITTDLSAVAGACDVILDVSLPTATASVIAAALETGKPLVSGTTGVSAEVMEQLEAASKWIPALHTRNFSVGVAVLASLVARAVSMLGSEYDVEIVEMHHRKKADAPSGTAGILADAAAGAAGLTRDDVTVYGRSGVTGERPRNQIGIHAVRGGGVFGDHTVILAGQSDRIELTHRVDSRALLAEGAVRCALFLAGKAPGRYTMKDVLGLE